MAGSHAPPPLVPLKGETCPRCGGVMCVRRPSVKNPFLSRKPTTEEHTCEDCGLDVQVPIGSPSGNDGPWHKGR